MYFKDKIKLLLHLISSPPLPSSQIIDRDDVSYSNSSDVGRMDWIEFWLTGMGLLKTTCSPVLQGLRSPGLYLPLVDFHGHAKTYVRKQRLKLGVGCHCRCPSIFPRFSHLCTLIKAIQVKIKMESPY